MFKRKKCLSYSFIDNSILLSTDTISKNGFVEVWRQTSTKNNSIRIQILCYNEATFEFQAFDRFHWSDEPIAIPMIGIDSVYKEDLWTPIKLHFSIEWIKRHLN